MKNRIVPFIHNLTKDDASSWLVTLQNAMPKITICFMTDLSKAERDSVQVAIVANPDPAELSELPHLKWVQSLWAGVERLIDESPDNKIQIVRLADPQMAETMSEAVLAWTLYLHRDIPKYAAQQSKGVWETHDVMMASERTIGVLGLGNLGQKTAEKLLHNNFKVVGWSRSEKIIPGMSTFNGNNGLLEVIQCADIIVILLPSTPQTRGLVNTHLIESMKQGASIINFARADIIDTAALTKGLEDRLIEHAVLDVFLREPLPKTSPLWNNPHVTVLPHISAPTNKQSASQIVAKNILTFFTSKKIPASVSHHNGY